MYQAHSAADNCAALANVPKITAKLQPLQLEIFCGVHT
jgi:hypothetical protein